MGEKKTQLDYQGRDLKIMTLHPSLIQKVAIGKMGVFQSLQAWVTAAQYRKKKLERESKGEGAASSDIFFRGGRK